MVCAESRRTGRSRRLRVDAEARPPRPRRRRRGPAVPLGLRRALRLRERLQAQRGRGGPAERRPGALDEAAGLVRGRAPERLGRRAREAQDRRPGPAPGRGGGLVALGRELQRRVPEPLADAVQELRRELRADRRQGLGLGQERLLRPLLRRLLERGEAVAHEGPAQRAVRARQLQRAGQLRGQLLGEAGVLRHAVVRAPRRERGRRRHAVLALFLLSRLLSNASNSKTASAGRPAQQQVTVPPSHHLCPLLGRHP